MARRTALRSWRAGVTGAAVAARVAEQTARSSSRMGAARRGARLMAVLQVLDSGRRFSLLDHDAFEVVLGLRNLNIEALEGLDQQRRDDQIAVPLLVRRHDVPGSP